MIITTEMIMEKKPCKEYTQERVQKLVGEGKTLLELTELDIPVLDRVWVIAMFLDDKTNRKFAIWCARQCKISIRAITDYIDITEKYYDGKATKEELKAARSAAYYAAYSTVYSAADYTANLVAYHTAYHMACYVACYAAYFAAYYAAYLKIEQKLQIEKLKELIGEK